MPSGIVVMEWNQKGGTDIIGIYPENTKINSKMLLQVYNTHAADMNEEAGITNFSDDKNSILSYFSGVKHNCYVILVLTMLEDCEDFEDSLVEVAKKILKNLENEAFKKMLPSLFDDIIKKKSEE